MNEKTQLLPAVELPLASTPTPTTPSRSRLHKPLRVLLVALLSVPALIYLNVTPLTLLQTASSGDSSLGTWLRYHQEIALNGILANIGPPAGAADGLVIASPSKSEPDYYYTWARDSAITMKTLIPLLSPAAYTGFSHPVHKGLIEPLMRSYISAQLLLQAGNNPSGDFWGEGMGEPKWAVDGSVFSGSWGRPQRDGPALRALTVIPYVDYLLERATPSDKLYVFTHLYSPTSLLSPLTSLLKNDLEYLSHHWRQPSFDLWEEVSGTHFFTLSVTRAALKDGARIAWRLRDDGAAAWYQQQAKEISAVLESAGFWDEDRGFIKATLENVQVESPPPIEGLGQWRSSMDCAVPLAIIHGGETGNATWSAGSDRVLATVRRYAMEFETGVYKLNDGRDWVDGLAIGRYREDVYDGVGRSKANPWFICTFSVAHTLRLAIDAFLTTESITITPTSLPFWSDLATISTPSLRFARALSKPQVGEVWTKGDGRFELALERLGVLSDRFLSVGKEFTPADGSMSEQYGRLDGTPKGAKHLTWSYGTLFDLADIRRAQTGEE